MKNKLEQNIDAQFEQMALDVHIFHIFNLEMPFNAITIADESINSWERASELIDIVLTRTKRGYTKTPATRFLKCARDGNIYGVAICDKRDQFNRQRGRIIAKGRLLKHLKQG